VVGLIVVEILAIGGSYSVVEGHRPVPAAVGRLPVVEHVAPDGGGPSTGQAPSPEAIARCVTGPASDRALGKRVAIGVTTTTGGMLFSRGPARATPASTLKLLTTTAALSAIGPDHRFATTVTLQGRRLTLVGGGDPLLATSGSTRIVRNAATLTDLAGQVKAAVAGGSTVRLAIDDSLFPGPGVSPAWEPGYVPENVVSPISALWVQEGRVKVNSFTRVTNPARAAGRAFARLLRQRGLHVRWAGRAESAAGARVVASVESPPVREIVRHVLAVSDNEGAEVLARQVAIATGGPGSADAAPQAVVTELRRLGLPVGGLRIQDGSGLSRHDVVPVSTLLAVLAHDISDPVARPVIADLPVSRFSGTLAYRFTASNDPVAGTVHAKTGTLTGVDALAGYVVDANGVPLVFAVLADRVTGYSSAARSALDRFAAALAGCGA
jgi:D-alanyl-D-alanine carboxypeptidase/D-alanyl-D-alanine-endopeptidase (penicillin-binding protein 4)